MIQGGQEVIPEILYVIHQMGFKNSGLNEALFVCLGGGSKSAPQKDKLPQYGLSALHKILVSYAILEPESTVYFETFHEQLHLRLQDAI